MKIIEFFYSALAGLLALLMVGCSDSSDDSVTEAPAPGPVGRTITFGIYTADKASAVVDEFAPIIAWLEESLQTKLGEPVDIRMKVANTYLQGISDIAIGNSDIARLGPASYIHAVDENPGLEILAMESNDGERTFMGIIAVHRDSDIQSLSDLEGRTFAFGSHLSTIGRYLSQQLLVEAGIRAQDLAGFEFLERHDVVGMAVGAGEFDAGALKSSSFQSLVESGQPLRKLVEFENVTKPWVANPELAPDLRKAIRESMLEIDAATAEKVGVDGFLESDPSYFEPIQTAMEASKQFNDGLAVRTDEEGEPDPVR